MRKYFLFIYLFFFVACMTQAQNRGTKLGYIDMEYILKNVPSYIEAQNQLEEKAQKWKQEIETKKSAINKLKEALKAEKALLTKGLIEERNKEIDLLEKENLEYQQKRFGPYGDLMTQKLDLTKPVQDQVFSIVQDIAETKKYDFIFDKTSDLTMLFAAKRFDISDKVVQVLIRTEKREQLTKKQLKEEEEKEKKEAREEAIADNPNLSERQKVLETKKAEREAAIAAKKLAIEEKRKTAEDKKLQIIADRIGNKNGTDSSEAKTTSSSNNSVDKETVAIEAKKAQANQRAEAIKKRKQDIEEKKKALEERKTQKLGKEENKTTNPSSNANTVAEPKIENKTSKETEVNTPATEKQQQSNSSAKKLEDRRNLAEENKKLQEEEKSKQSIVSKQFKKIGTISENLIKEVAKVTDTTSKPKTDSTKTLVEKANMKQADIKKTIKERKKTLKEKINNFLDVIDVTKKTTEEKSNTTKENTNNN